MAGVREVAQQVQRARGKTGECAAAVRQAGELARDALELLGGACRGAVALEDRAAQVVRQWTAVVEGSGRLARRLADLDAGLQELLNRLLGDRDAHRPASSPSRQATPSSDPSVTEAQRMAHRPDDSKVRLTN